MSWRVIGSVPGSVLGSVIKASWELVWEHTVKQFWTVASSTSETVRGSMSGNVLDNVLEGVLGSILGGVHGSVLGGVNGSVLGVYLVVSWALTWECIVKQAGSILSSTLPDMLSRTLTIALDDTLPACLTVHCQGTTQDNLQHTFEHALKYTPIALNDTLPACLTIRSQVSSQNAPNYTPSTFSNLLLGILSRTLLIALGGTLAASLTYAFK